MRARATFKGPETRLVWTRRLPRAMCQCARRVNPKRGRGGRGRPRAGGGLQSEPQQGERKGLGHSQARLLPGNSLDLWMQSYARPSEGDPVERSRARTLQERAGGGWLRNLLLPV